MYSGLFPKGVSEADLSSDEDDVIENKKQGIKTEGLNECTPSRFDDTSEFASDPVPTPISAFSSERDLAENEASSNHCLPGVPVDKWQKFKDLQKAKEIQRMTQVLPRRQRKKRHKKDKSGTPSTQPDTSSELEEQRKKHWEELTQYFAVNDRFEPPPCSRPPRKSGLEKSIESAIAEGDYGKAEALSDRLATRELAVKISQAVDCRDYVKTKQEAEASRATQKRKKQIAWGFEAKKRWETKSNMGYM
ncbi:protein FAM204A [Chanos chanos]|uniref:Protein FAM204A n=1 Tax=Chanos chanos TaxID=29144 RepID=A0A6J2V6F7_CHACN|nr:protein FAM204A [Chanos chanos]